MKTTMTEEQEMTEEEAAVEDQLPFSRDDLINFVDKYRLNGEVERVLISVSDEMRNEDTVYRTIQTAFATDDRTVLGNVQMFDFQFEECEFGVFESKSFKSLLKTLDERTDISLRRNAADVPQKIVFEDNHKTLVYNLSNSQIIDRVPSEPKRLPDFNITFDITDEFRSNFKSAVGALSSDLFGIGKREGELAMTVGIGRTDMNNTITLYPETESFEFSGTNNEIQFRGDLFNEAMNANTDAETAYCEIFAPEDENGRGFIRLTFESDRYRSVYHIVAQS